MSNNNYSKGFNFLQNISISTVVLVSVGLVIYVAIAFVFVGDVTANVTAVLIMVLPPSFMCVVIGINAARNESEKRLKRIFDAMQEVSKGNFEYKIKEEDAKDFTQLFKDFNSMTEQLYKIRAELESFSVEFAHELNTPISLIQGYASLLFETGKDIEDKERLGYLKLISDEASRLARLSSNALFLSKLRAIQILPDKENYNLGEQIRRCIILFDKEIQNKKINIVIPEVFDPVFYGNKEIMQHVWINLISNAIKFSPQGGNLTIDFYSQAKKNYISISDEGPGIPKQIVPFIFESKDIIKKKSLPGNGLGLMIAKRASILNNADLVLDENYKNGAKFTVIF